MDALVSTAWLAAKGQAPRVRVVDVRWYLFEPDKTGCGEYARGHIPGAVFVDVATELSAPAVHGPGRHPLPSAATFAAAMSRAGVGPDTHVVAYDDHGGATAARLWWLLRYFGHEQVSLLDGGIVQWIAEGRALETATPQVAPAPFVARPHPEMVVDKHDVDHLRGDARALLLDARVPERYRGEVEPIDARPGHVPGAVNAPLAGNLRGADDLRFLPPAVLRQRYEALGAGRAERIVAYCGSGINASQTLFALHHAGFAGAQLYEGSWSDWSRDARLPSSP